jgi:NAD(P)H dehydrogenase (quinone)
MSDRLPVRIAVTGATGALGGLVAHRLADLSPVLIVRDPARAPVLAGAEVRQAEYADYDSVLAALDGVDVLFVVSATESQRRREDHRRVVMAAAEMGVRQVVYTSFAGAGGEATTFSLVRDHAYTEAAIRASGLDFTFLRDNFYLEGLPFFADHSGVIRGPAGDGRFAPVSRRDVADVAAAVLRQPAAHSGAAYTLTGPEPITLTEAAARLSALLGREFRFEDETEDAARVWRREKYDAEDWQLDAWVSTYTAIRNGSLAGVTDDVARVSGHPARTLEQALTE